jgi:hypothetical protein
LERYAVVLKARGLIVININGDGSLRKYNRNLELDNKLSAVA